MKKTLLVAVCCLCCLSALCLNKTQRKKVPYAANVQTTSTSRNSSIGSKIIEIADVTLKVTLHSNASTTSNIQFEALLKATDEILNMLYSSLHIESTQLTVSNVNYAISESAISNILQIAVNLSNLSESNFSVSNLNSVANDKAVECIAKHLAIKKHLAIISTLNMLKSDKININTILVSINECISDSNKLTVEYSILKDMISHANNMTSKYVDSEIAIVPSFSIHTLKHSNVYRQHYYKYINATSDIERTQIRDEIIKLMACEIIKYELRHPDIKLQRN